MIDNLVRATVQLLQDELAIRLPQWTIVNSGQVAIRTNYMLVARPVASFFLREPPPFTHFVRVRTGYMNQHEMEISVGFYRVELTTATLDEEEARRLIEFATLGGRSSICLGQLVPDQPYLIAKIGCGQTWDLRYRNQDHDIAYVVRLLNDPECFEQMADAIKNHMTRHKRK